LRVILPNSDRSGASLKNKKVMAAQSIQLTGANGLIGFNLVRRLQSEGRGIVAVDRSIAKVRAVTVAAFEFEISDAHRLHEIAASFDIDAIVRCGGVSCPLLGRDTQAMLFRVNVGGTLDVAEVARQRANSSARRASRALGAQVICRRIGSEQKSIDSSRIRTVACCCRPIAVASG
jgi:NAD(P)-dependent dehydrogenase (short-subunit alcohol dehydrogenase family)